MNTWLVTEKDKLYIVADAQVLKAKPVLSEEAEKFVTAISKTKEDEDLLWFCGRYCTADVRNANGDGFKLNDLKSMYAHAIFKPVNWLHHEFEKIGFIVDSQLKEDKSEAFVDITGIVWCSTPHDAKYADSIIAYFDSGALGLSMETMGNRVECSECGKQFPIYSGNMEDPYGHYCEHLKSRKVNGSTRWILGPKFSGVGIIPARGRHQPADNTAWVREIASINDENGKEDEEIMADKIVYSEEQHNQLVKAAVDSVIKEKVDPLKTELADAKTKSEGLKAKIVDLDEKLEVKEGELTQANDDLTDANKEKKGLQTKVDAYDQEKVDAETTKFDARVKELKEINDSVTDEVADKLKAEILDDDKFDGVKAMFSKKEGKTPTKPTKKVTIESPGQITSVETDAETLREAINKKTEQKE